MPKPFIVRPLNHIFVLFWSLGISYFTYNIFTFFALICIAFIIISLVNLTGGDFSFLDDLFSRLGNNQVQNINIDEKDFLSILGILSIVVTILGIVFSHILKVFGVNKNRYRPRRSYLIGFTIITCLMSIAMVSNYFPNAPSGAPDLWPQILIFWLIALISYSLYTLVKSFQNFVVSKLENIGLQ